MKLSIASEWVFIWITAEYTEFTISWMPAAVWPDCSASLRISPATTEKPLPASPARAASMAAFRARRLVWLVMDRMESAKVLISVMVPEAAMAFDKSVLTEW
ncbi:hypothetical protein D3C73_1334080 [compost metagenome]